jgi:FkbM family methyltransferase
VNAASEFTPYIKRKNVEGVEFDFLIGDPEARSWYDVDCTDPDWPEMRFMRDRMVAPGDVVLECGGHHGCTAILLSRWVGERGRIITFEPHPRNAAILRRNLQLNGITNVTLRENAVGASHGTVAITDASNSAVRRHRFALNAVKANMVTLDDFANERPTLLKIDVEGFELAVLQGAGEVLKARPKLAIEIHADELHRYGTSVAQLMGCLDLSGYEQWIQWDDASPAVRYDGAAPITSRVHLFAIPAAAPR